MNGTDQFMSKISYANSFGSLVVIAPLSINLPPLPKTLRMNDTLNVVLYIIMHREATSKKEACGGV